MPTPEQVRNERQRTTAIMEELIGDDVDAIDIKSVTPDEAPFLARIVSKLSPIIGNLMEQRIVSLLGKDPLPGFSWKRQDPGFPDALLEHVDGAATNSGYEIKAWYVLSTEITGRFRESQNLLADKDIDVVIVAWCLSNLVFGSPKVLGIFIAPGQELARSRDIHYHKPPAYLIIEPNDTTSRAANLQQSNVNGFRLQETECDPEILQHERSSCRNFANPHQPDAQTEARRLMNILSYRLDTNFAKIDRVKHGGVDSFKQEILSSTYLGTSISEWKSIFRNLESESVSVRTLAETVIRNLYSKMLVNEPQIEVLHETPNVP